ncbi:MULTISPECIES: ABC transporter substrate-binding protein [Streptomycetaceae]|uniref:Leucine-binding protein domain-containing protein n=1 Tax=Streptantibioticus cattleyicolor (strain ATCC 35852 / DSM 46488 / JCM 4925 / NBRC 14057 / NRRL 8057) TaxID=1003195 RepID=F8JWS3_STREN|nr:MULTISPECIES: ABC transporter substrate-binding protein [Streptomycetaceae]AEW97075.1 hypothetical protein SCATT_47040 [Streptantibioticus cattleyicolor NRRL 8057 = DSM 46488]MYS61537.1 ABC transporter substrate-binding protein [Streptomyces sp. SID5468]CCB77399.1 conserved protein of unknown function [Streptantibioticus cattleyicolor NRRL 8057 = DSM 46488]
MSAANGPGPTWDPPRRWWQRPWRVAALVVAVVLVAAGVYWVVRPSVGCGVSGVEKHGPDHECVGVTDGSYAFSPDLAHLSDLVRQENERVAKGGGDSWVSVVYLASMVPGEGGTTTTDSIRHELEGAYTAQWVANNTHTHGDAPKIRLLLAHSGGSDDARAFTLRRIEERIGPDHIVAVAGLGTSTSATRATIKELIGHDLATFGSVLTSNDLTGLQGLARVVPANSDEAAAAATYLRSSHPGAKVLLVQDRRSDDLYTRTLADSFRASYPPGDLVSQPMVYDSSKSDVATYFTQAMANVCLEKPQVIFYAGRGVDLPKFLSPLAGRQCADQPLTVLSGDDASLVERSAGIDEVKDALRLGNIRLVYTGLAHPEAWTKRPQSFNSTAIAPFQSGGRFPAAFPHEPLDDGQAITGYDAVLTAVTAIRYAAQGPSGPNRVRGQDVIQMLPALTGVKAVSGASGLISLDPDGNPVNKAIPIVELNKDGSVHTVAVSSRNGTPPDARPQGG